MKKKRSEKAVKWCFRCYLGSFVWLIVSTLLTARWAPLIVGVLLMVPGCAVGLYGWSLLGELTRLPPKERPGYYSFLNRYRVRNAPFLYLFGLIALFLLC